MSGRRLASSRTRKASRAASSQSAYDPSPSADVMAVNASVWRAESCRTSSRASVTPKAATRRSTSVRRPSAMRRCPVASSDRWQRRRSAARSSAVDIDVGRRRRRRAGLERRFDPPSASPRDASARREAGRDTARGLPAHARAAPRWRSRSRAHPAALRSRADTAPRRPSVTAGTARRVTSGVTCGLPSRSPPIHEPNRSGAASIGSPRPVLARSARSTLAHVLRQRVPQALFEDDETAPHLVDRRRPLPAHVAGAPRGLNLAPDPRDQVVLLRRGEVRTVALRRARRQCGCASAPAAGAPPRWDAR